MNFELRFRRIFCLLAVTLALTTACGGTATPPPTATPNPQVLLGKSVFTRECARCHAVNEDTIIVGPSLQGIAARAGGRVAGQDAHTYLLTSILRPDAYLVEGFENLMPTTLGKQLTGEELDAVIAYLLTLEAADTN